MGIHLVLNEASSIRLLWHRRITSPAFVGYVETHKTHHEKKRPKCLMIQLQLEFPDVITLQSNTEIIIRTLIF